MWDDMLTFYMTFTLWDVKKTFLQLNDLIFYCSFVEKTSVKQDHKVCSNIQMSFLHLSQMDPPVEATGGQEWY